MKILFSGSPSIAVPSLESIHSLEKTGYIEEIELCGVLTNPDTAKGRHGTPLPTDVGAAAARLGVNQILKPVKLDAATREQVDALKPDLLVSFAYGRLFGPKFLALFPLGGINIHPSLLPKYRGPTPLQAAILNRDTVTGITIQTLAKEMDSGDIILQEELFLTGKETLGSLSDIAAVKAALMLPSVMKKFTDSGSFQDFKPQDHEKASYCSLISKKDGIIDWLQSAAVIEAKIRAFDPWPLCWTIHNGRELIILKADVYPDQSDKHPPGTVLGNDKNYGILIQTGQGILGVTQLQYQAKKALFWRDFLNGARDFTGSQLN